MTLDATLRWKAHVKKKYKELGLKQKKNVFSHGKKIDLVDTQ
jgi:hypothetical protein